LGRDIDTSDEEKIVSSANTSAGFYGVNYAPFMIPDPAKGLSTLNAVAGMKMDRAGSASRNICARSPACRKRKCQTANKAQGLHKVMEEARAMMGVAG